MRLFIDCAGSRSFVALEDGGFFASHLLPQGKEAERMQGAVAALLALRNSRYGDVSEIWTHTGPGSFTGIRIAMAFALGAARVSGAKTYGMNGFSRLAAQTDARPSSLAVAIGAGRGQVYMARMTDDYLPLLPVALKESEAKNYARNDAVIADNRAAEALRRYDIQAHSPLLGALATKKASLRLSKKASAFAPFYVRPPDAKPQPPFVPAGKEFYA